MGNILTTNFWLALRPEPLVNSMQFLLIAVLAVFFIVAFIVFLKKKSKKKITFLEERVASFCSSNFLIGLFLLFFSYEMVPFLSSRFWFLLWALEMGFWSFFLNKKRQEILIKRQIIDKAKELKKYLP